jgi:retron-type reverse transcriptase
VTGSRKEAGSKALARRTASGYRRPGVDDVSVSEFKDWLKMHWPSVKKALLEGRYLPRPVRRVDIPKPSGGIRTLGVPTLVDRLIQQALHQVLQPLFEPTFSDASYGFRPGRGAHQAVRKAQGYIREGKRWVVDIDLETLLDRVSRTNLFRATIWQPPIIPRITPRRTGPRLTGLPDWTGQYSVEPSRASCR